MHPKTREFIRKLADLCGEYQADISYTIDDDGLHVGTPHDRNIAIGFCREDMLRALSPRTETADGLAAKRKEVGQTNND